MSRKDEVLLAERKDLRENVRLLKADVQVVKNAQRRIRLRIRNLLNAGLTARFVGKIAGMSHQTALRIQKEENGRKHDQDCMLRAYPDTWCTCSLRDEDA